MLNNNTVLRRARWNVFWAGMNKRECYNTWLLLSSCSILLVPQPYCSQTSWSRAHAVRQEWSRHPTRSSRHHVPSLSAAGENVLWWCHTGGWSGLQQFSHFQLFVNQCNPYCEGSTNKFWRCWAHNCKSKLISSTKHTLLLRYHVVNTFDRLHFTPRRPQCDQ